MKIIVKTNAKEVINDLLEYENAFIETSERKLKEVIEILKQAIISYTPVGVGPKHLKDNIEVDLVTKGRVVYVNLSTPLSHGNPVEYGSRPHSAPVAPLIAWVEGKLGYSGKEAVSIAWAVRETIKKRGTPAFHMFEKGFLDTSPQIVDILNTIPQSIIDRISRHV